MKLQFHYQHIELQLKHRFTLHLLEIVYDISLFIRNNTDQNKKPYTHTRTHKTLNCINHLKWCDQQCCGHLNSSLLVRCKYIIKIDQLSVVCFLLNKNKKKTHNLIRAFHCISLSLSLEMTWLNCRDTSYILSSYNLEYHYAFAGIINSRMTMTAITVNNSHGNTHFYRIVPIFSWIWPIFFAFISHARFKVFNSAVSFKMKRRDFFHF